MKRFLGLFMMILCVFALFAGCSNKSDETKSTEQQTQKLPSSPDLISGKTLTGGDKSSLQLKDDGSYIWYQNASVTDDNYYKGTYKIYVGAEAISVLGGMSRYGVTEQEQLDLIARNADRGLTADDWYVMVQNRTYRLVDGKETNENTTIVYMGFYYKDQNTYDAANCNSGNYASFTVE